MVVVIVTAKLSELFIPYLLERLVDAFGRVPPVAIGFGGFVIAFVLPIAGLRLLSLMLWRMSGFLASELQPRVMSDLMERAFSAIMDQSYRFFSDNFGGALVRRAQAVANSFRTLANAFWWDILPVVVTVASSMILLGLRSPLFAAIIGVWIIGLISSQLLVSRLKLPYDAERASKHAAIIGLLSDDITNATNVMLFNGRKSEERLMRQRVDLWRFFNVKQWRIAESGNAIQNTFNFFCEVLTMGLAVWLWMHGTMSLGAVMFVQSLLWVLFNNT